MSKLREQSDTANKPPNMSKIQHLPPLGFEPFRANLPHIQLLSQSQPQLKPPHAPLKPLFRLCRTCLDNHGKG